jgi:hypothetical protein
MKKLVSIMAVLSILVIAVILTGCEQKPVVAPNVTLEGAVISSGNNSVTLNESEIQPVKETETTTSISTEEFKNVSYTVTAIEGDLVTLKVRAVDPDGLKLTYSFGKPFNDQGLWQTEDGDVGKYLIRVTASDGLSSTNADVLVIINSRNKAPVIDCQDEVRVKEGETVNLDCTFFDRESDSITTEYTGWMTSPTYTTNFDSAGEHKVLVKATDGISNATKTVVVYIENVPRAPVFNEHLKDMTVTESDIVTLKLDVTEPDVGETVKLKYSEPFDNNGVWKTVLGDAGTYPITVVATSQGLSTKESFTLTVKMLNTAPVMGFIPNITVSEGDTVKIIPDIADREDDVVTVTYSGWMKDSSYTTTFDDAYPDGCDKPECSATYKVTVAASDGAYIVSQDVFVTVVDKNRAPVFVWQ